MTTWHLEVKIDQHVPDDNGFYTCFSNRRIVVDTKHIKDMLKKMFSDAMYFVDENLIGNGDVV